MSSEHEIRTELTRLLLAADVSSETANLIVGRVMDLVEDYASERAGDAAYDAAREYEERM